MITSAMIPTLIVLPAIQRMVLRLRRYATTAKSATTIIPFKSAHALVFIIHNNIL